jgi:hypothetical protein
MKVIRQRYLRLGSITLKIHKWGSDKARKSIPMNLTGSNVQVLNYEDNVMLVWQIDVEMPSQRLPNTATRGGRSKPYTSAGLSEARVNLIHRENNCNTTNCQGGEVIYFMITSNE